MGQSARALVADAMMTPVAAIWGGTVPAEARVAADATALALETTPPITLTVRKPPSPSMRCPSVPPT